MIYFLTMLLITGQCLCTNPFDSTLEVDSQNRDQFFKQTPPFTYPFNQDDNLNSYRMNLAKLSKMLGLSKLDELQNVFKQFIYDEKLNLYAYDFSTGTNWDILPHPIIKSLDGQDPKDWSHHFNNQINENEGVHALTFLKEIDMTTGTKSYAGNSLELLKTPKSRLKIMEKLAEAKDHVFMSGFLFQCDAGSKDILTLLEKKIKMGVNVFLILDSTFTMSDRRCVRRLKQMGVILGLAGGLLKFFHEKMYVFDGEYGIIDGQNIVSAQTLSNGHNNLINDMGIGFKGPIVQEVAHRFLDHWVNLMKKKMPKKIIEFYKNKKSDAIEYQGDDSIQRGLQARSGVCRLVVENPGSSKRKILPMYQAYIKEAQNYIFFNMIDLRFEKLGGNSVGIQFLDDIINKSLSNKDLRVDMLTNQWKLPTDIELPRGLAKESNLFSFLITRPGLLFFELPHKQIGKGRNHILPMLDKNNFNWWASAQYNHSKTMMIDNITTMVGSYNINDVSNKRSYEQVLVCNDQQIAEEMQKSILQDLLNSIPINLNR